MVSPLDVLLGVMARKWAAGDEDGAVALAKAAAPYVHPRASARGIVDLAGVGDAELDRLERGAGAEGTDQE